MFQKLKEIIQLWMPLWLIIWLYKYNRAIPANIKTAKGGLLKAIMITKNYGVLFTVENYTMNRIKYLQALQDKVNNESRSIAKEMNELSFEARELFYSKEQNENRSSR